MNRSTQRIQERFSLLLAGKPLQNFGARKALAMSRQQRALPFTPICVFGFQLDEAGAGTNGGSDPENQSR
jgi:hypothetical protein